MLGGYFSNDEFGRIGLETKFPPQFGQIPLRISLEHFEQNVHSKVQIIASSEEGGRSLSQHSQFGLNSSINIQSLEFLQFFDSA